MAFNWPTFRTRTLTATVFVAVMLTGLLWNHWSFLLLFSIIHFGCWREYLLLIEKIYDRKFHLHFKLGVVLIGYGWMLWFCGPSYQIASYGLKENFSLIISLAGLVLAIAVIFRTSQINLRSFAAAVAGLIYISLSWGLMIHLRSAGQGWLEAGKGVDDRGWIIPVVIIASIWINDTMAYIVGSLIGRTPFSKISPKKTWEGTAGGVVLAVVVVTILWVWIVSPDYWIHLSIIAAIASVMGTLGDLFESKLKRMAAVKDSGQIMPGHGGFLDRFDSLLLAIPFVWLYVHVF